MIQAAPPHAQDDGIDGLAFLALTYLALPNLIFVFGWFRFPIATVLAGAVLYLLASTLGAGNLRWRTTGSPLGGLLILAAGFAWAAFGGGSHFMHANVDWTIRDSVLGDLTHGAWPPAYQPIDGYPNLLRSAIGYFLPPALAGKLFGTSVLPAAVFLWTAIGVSLFLFLLPLREASGRKLPLLLLIIVFFSGADVLGYLVSNGEFPEFPGRIEWWGPYSYSSLSGQLLWAPNHATPIWIATALFYRHRNDARLPGLLAVALPLTLIWTPFAILGIFPFAVFALVRKLAPPRTRDIRWAPYIAALILSLPIVLFLTVDIDGISRSPAVPTAAVAARDDAVSAGRFLQYLVFASFEVLLPALALFVNLKGDRSYFLLAVSVLLLLPALSFGPSNDAALRLSVPALVVLALLSVEVVTAGDFTPARPQAALLCLVLAIGANTALNELSRAALFRRWTPDYTRTLADLQGGAPASHYAGRMTSRTLAWLLREPQPVPPAAARRADSGGTAIPGRQDDRPGVAN